MNNLFKRKKNPEQLVKGLKESLDDLESKRTTHHHSIFHPMTVNHSAVIRVRGKKRGVKWSRRMMRIR